MSKDGLFEMAQALRRTHCDRQDAEHECVGEVTIKRGEVCLSCTICGSGEHIPGWSSSISDLLREVFRAAGVEWDSLHMEAKLAAILEYEQSAAQRHGEG